MKNSLWTLMGNLFGLGLKIVQKAFLKQNSMQDIPIKQLKTKYETEWTSNKTLNLYIIEGEKETVYNLEKIYNDLDSVYTEISQNNKKLGLIEFIINLDLYKSTNYSTNISELFLNEPKAFYHAIHNNIST